jgi:hypothetical protein
MGLAISASLNGAFGASMTAACIWLAVDMVTSIVTTPSYVISIVWKWKNT